MTFQQKIKKFTNLLNDLYNYDYDRLSNNTQQTFDFLISELEKGIAVNKMLELTKEIGNDKKNFSTSGIQIYKELETFF